MRARDGAVELAVPGDIWWRVSTVRRAMGWQWPEHRADVLEREVDALRRLLVDDAGTARAVCRQAIRLLDVGDLDEALALLDPYVAEAGAKRMKRWAER